MATQPTSCAKLRKWRSILSMCLRDFSERTDVEHGPFGRCRVPCFGFNIINVLTKRACTYCNGPGIQIWPPTADIGIEMKWGTDGSRMTLGIKINLNEVGMIQSVSAVTTLRSSIPPSPVVVDICWGKPNLALTTLRSSIPPSPVVVAICWGKPNLASCYERPVSTIYKSEKYWTFDLLQRLHRERGDVFIDNLCQSICGRIRLNFQNPDLDVNNT